MHQLALAWGVEAHRVPRLRSTDAVMSRARTEVRRRGLAGPGERMAIVAGVPLNEPGKHQRSDRPAGLRPSRLQRRAPDAVFSRTDRAPREPVEGVRHEDPHFKMPGASIEVFEFLSMPGM